MKSAVPAAHTLLLIPLVEQSVKKGLCLISVSFPLSSIYHQFIQPGSLRGRGGLPRPGPAYPRASFLVNSSVGYQADERSRPRARRYGVQRREHTVLGKGR